ncbi:9473_t:CDS:10 [Entrophospora sp. SA101]|nr:9473_t:CDS:10 [Entrophospora sp. SA101]
MNYCEQIKASPDGWKLCLSFTPEARVFALQVLDDVLQNRFTTLDSSQIIQIRSTLMEFFQREYVVGDVNDEPQYLKNKFATTLTLLFVQLYPSNWQNFFDEFLLLIQSNNININGERKTNSRTVDIFLRILLSIDEKVANIAISRGKEEAIRNTTIKDNMRAGDIQKLATIWYEILNDYRLQNQDIAQMSWIDISLIVNDAFISLLYQLLSDSKLKISACECLAESDDIVFVEHVARLTNVLGVELCKIWEGADQETRNVAYNQIEYLLEFLLKFLADEYDDTSSAVFPFVTAFQSLLKRQKKIAGELTGEQREFLASLLKVVIIKMKYDESTDWNGTDEEAEEEAEFLEMRKFLKQFFDVIHNIDEQIFTTFVHSAIINTFENYQKIGNEFDWRDLELSLHVLLLYGEALKGSMSFVLKQNNEVVALSPLGEMILKMFQCNVFTYPHPSTALIFFEIVVRYYQFFEVQPEYIPIVLEAFIDTRGLHSINLQIRSRSWYLFYKFVKSLKSKMSNYVETVLSSIQDLLIIQLDPAITDAAGEILLAKEEAMDNTFTNQLYLFETVGILITIDSVPIETQMEYLKAIVGPLLAELQQNLETGSKDVRTIIQIHHLMMAIGSIAKGFPEASKGVAQTVPWIDFMKQTTEAILVVLKTLSNFEIIRDSARYAFARLVNVLGIEILPYLPPLIDGLLNETPSGTDETILFVVLRKAYLNFILGLLNGGMDQVLISELNKPNLENILQSVIHYASDTSEISSLKISFNILSRAISLWGVNPSQITQDITTTATVTTTNNSSNDAFSRTLESQPLPGFERFMYEHILRVCFELPMKQSFDVADGQSSVVSEISNMIKTMYTLRGNEFLEYTRNIWLRQDLADEFLQALQQLDQKAFKKYFTADEVGRPDEMFKIKLDLSEIRRIESSLTLSFCACASRDVSTAIDAILSTARKELNASLQLRQHN